VKRFPVPLYSTEGQHKPDKYTLSSPNDYIKCTVHVNGDTITFGEICFKVQRNQLTTYRTAITHDNPWKLQQVQDAGNHLQMALLMLTNLGENYVFRSSEEVLHILGNVLGALQRGRTCLIVPRKRTMDELMKSKNMVRYQTIKIISRQASLSGLPTEYTISNLAAGGVPKPYLSVANQKRDKPPMV